MNIQSIHHAAVRASARACIARVPGTWRIFNRALRASHEGGAS
ncbi:hypothetical protein AWB78_02118 [Caballeronia calidae]|uniref:Uncharacterized protein n=1 Tax=Caballeronia calidae TaxID=1777139 RepID=A0A158B1M9_9BURK|nr:hypothetical protein [Caballeronia calidae]SAK63157.1 hypothetical protein AWB78_02118 [Caballeronia calidae]